MEPTLRQLLHRALDEPNLAAELDLHPLNGQAGAIYLKFNVNPAVRSADGKVQTWDSRRACGEGEG